MAMLQMQLINIYALNKYCKDILETLQRRGVVEIENLDIRDSVFFKEDTDAMQAQYMRSANVARAALQVLDEYQKEKKGLLSSFKGRTPNSREEYNRLVDSTSDILKTAYDIVSYKKNIELNETEIIKYESQLEAVRPWLSLTVPMNFSGTALTKAFIGKFSGKKTSGDILRELALTDPEIERVEVEVIYCDENQSCVFILCSNIEEEKLSTALRKIGFEYPSYQSPVIPAQREKEIIRHINNRKGRILESENNIKALVKYRSKLKFLEDYYVMKAERYEAYDDLSMSNNTFVMTGTEDRT